MLLVALFISESRGESKLQTAKPLFTFVVVSHVIMLDKLYETGLHTALWTIVKDFYQGLTSKVKWTGGMSDSFNIKMYDKEEYFQPFYTKFIIIPYLKIYRNIILDLI